VAPLTFVLFGSYLAKIGKVPVGQRFTTLARSLLDKLDAKEVAGQVMFLAEQIQCYTEPMQALHELKSEGEAAALSVGDTHWACSIRYIYCSDLLLAGTHLSIVNDKAIEAHQFIKGQQDKNVLVFISMTQRSLNILLGKEAATIDHTNPRQRLLQ
jgi:hypothetical protein